MTFVCVVKRKKNVSRFLDEVGLLLDEESCCTTYSHFYDISSRLTKDDVAETGIIGLKFVKFQNVHSLTVRKQGLITLEGTRVCRCTRA